MTAVDVVTGEIVGDLTADEARQIVARVRAGVDTVRVDITRLHQGKAHVALGYASWDSMCDGELGIRLALPRDDRVALVTDLRDQGMSTRAIGSALGIDHTTVMDDARRGGNPPPAEITGTDGKTYIPPVRPAIPPRKPRTLVTEVMHRVVTRAADAAADANQILPSHLAGKPEEAAAWSRSLSESMQSLQRLLDALMEASA